MSAHITEEDRTTHKWTDYQIYVAASIVSYAFCAVDLWQALSETVYFIAVFIQTKKLQVHEKTEQVKEH
jgi:hypothetical protein